MNRRAFLGSGLALGAGLAAELPAAADPPKPKALLKVSSQEPIIPGRDLNEKLDKMEKWGFDGIEFWGGGLAGRVEEIQKALKGRKITISAVCAGFEGALISDQSSEREKAVNTTKRILTVAGELGATGMVLVPAFNGQTKYNHVEGRKVLMDILPEIGSYGEKVKSRILLEPLNRGEAWFLRQLADAAAICREINSPGVRMMGDMYHMYLEEPNDMGAFISARQFLHHVHIASIKRNLPGQDERDFRDGFQGSETDRLPGLLQPGVRRDGRQRGGDPQSRQVPPQAVGGSLRSARYRPHPYRRSVRLCHNGGD